MPLYRCLMFLFLLFDSSSLILSFRYSLFFFLKCLLASSLTSLRLSSFAWLGSYNHCSLACFLRSANFERFSSNHGLWCFDSQLPRPSWTEILMFSLILTHAPLMSPLSSKFSRAANVFLIVTWCCSLTSPSFNFLTLDHPLSIFCAARLLAASLSLTFATTK
jgi:hypothetical protein